MQQTQSYEEFIVFESINNRPVVLHHTKHVGSGGKIDRRYRLVMSSVKQARRSTHSATQRSEKLFVPAGTDVQLGGGDREHSARSNKYSLVAAVVVATAAAPEVPAAAVVYGGAADVTERRWKDGEPGGGSSLYSVSVISNYCQTSPFRLCRLFGARPRTSY